MSGVVVADESPSGRRSHPELGDRGVQGLQLESAGGSHAQEMPERGVDETAMAGHPQLSAKDASEMVKYILNIANEAPKAKSLPVQGKYTAKAPEKDKNKGVFIVRAAYEDQGANGLPALKSEQTFVLRNSKIDAHGFDEYVDVNKMAFGGNNLAIPAKSGAFMIMKQIDLNGIKEIQVFATAPKPQLNAVGGIVEVHIGNATGKKIGQSEFLEPSDKMDFSPKVVTVPINLAGLALDKLQDICVVFVNQKSENQSLMVVMGAEVKMYNEGEAPVVVESKAPGDFFKGNWTFTIYGTPQGDAELLLALDRTEGKLTGTVTPKGQNTSVSIDKIEEGENNIKLFFKMAGFDLNVNLEKEDNDTLSGKMMGMFKTKAIRNN